MVARPQSTGVKVSLYLSIMKVLGAVRQSSLERICMGVCVCVRVIVVCGLLLVVCGLSIRRHLNLMSCGIIGTTRHCMPQVVSCLVY